MNPLNELSFDINALIPYQEFNWDTVQGIDDVHKDTMNTYGNIVKHIGSNIGKVEDRIGQVDGGITETVRFPIVPINNRLSVVTDNIRQDLTTSLSNSQAKYGTPSQPLRWWIVYRQSSCDEWVPGYEQRAIQDLTTESYGPFEYPCIAGKAVWLLQNNPGFQLLKLKGMLVIPQDTIRDKAYRFSYDQIASLTQDQTLFSPNPPCPELGEIIPFSILDCPPTDVPPELMNCDWFLSQTWHYLLDANGQESYRGSKDGQVINKETFSALVYQCGKTPPIDNPPNPSDVIPPIVPPNVGGDKCSPQMDKLPLCPPPQVIVNIPPVSPPVIPPTVCPTPEIKVIVPPCPPSSNVGGGSVAIDLREVVDSLKLIVKALAECCKQLVKPPPGSGRCEDYGDSAFIMSNCGEADAIAFLEREEIKETGGKQFNSIGDAQRFVQGIIEDKQQYDMSLQE